MSNATRSEGLPVHPEHGWAVDPATGQVFGARGRHRGKVIGRVADTGYVRTTVYGKPVYMHRAVWEACVGPIPPGLYINHINGIKTDNRLENLEVVTPSENLRHAFRIGLAPRGMIRGPKNG